MWSNDDPRKHIRQRGEIVIILPGAKGYDAILGKVETENGWFVATERVECGYVGQFDTWDERWFWVEVPTKKEVR
jgi:hypothetical protein